MEHDTAERRSGDEVVANPMGDPAVAREMEERREQIEEQARQEPEEPPPAETAPPPPTGAPEPAP